MKKIHVVLLLIVAIAFCSCSFRYAVTKDKVMKLEVGMTKTEVLDIFGKPNYRSITDDYSEVWEYRESVYKGHDVIKLIFEHNKVASFESYFLQDVVVPQQANTD